jgi:transposase-like protein
MSTIKKPSAKELIDKIEEAKGNISAIARAYKVSRTAVYQWIDSYETAKQALSDQREFVVDAAESILYKRAIKDENDNSIFYILNNMQEARDRGWGIQRHEHKIDINRLHELSDDELRAIIED